MNVATIVPTAYLHLTEDDDYFMALAHLVGVDKEYTRFFRARAEEGKFVLMDNGIVEGDQQDVGELVRRARLIKATEVILPDTIQRGADTLMKSHRALPLMKGLGFRLMAVPQGCNVSEWVDCANTMLLWEGIDTIGVSKFVVNAASNARELCIASIKDKVEELGLNLHLLGVWRDIAEIEILRRKYPWIRGVDSGVAYMFTKREEWITPTDKMDVRIDFDDKGIDEVMLRQNIEEWRYLASGEDNRG